MDTRRLTDAAAMPYNGCCTPAAAAPRAPGGFRKERRFMPLIIPQTLPAYKALEEENVFVMHRARAMTQDIRPLRILLVNLMPTKIATETQIARMLANSPLQVELTLLHMDSHESTHVPGAHLEAFYKTFDEIKTERFDGMIVTGAPVEMLAYEEVDYWPELCAIFEYSKTHVYSTVHICWGAQAALYYHYGIHKRVLPQKVFGIFAHRVTRPKTRWCAALTKCSTLPIPAIPSFAARRWTPALRCVCWPKAAGPGCISSPRIPAARSLCAAIWNTTATPCAWSTSATLKEAFPSPYRRIILRMTTLPRALFSAGAATPTCFFRTG